MKNFKFLIRLDENRNGVGNSIKCKLVNFIFNSASLLSEPQLIYDFNEILSFTRNVEKISFNDHAEIWIKMQLG